jgi:hypothetical protein
MRLDALLAAATWTPIAAQPKTGGAVHATHTATLEIPGVGACRCWRLSNGRATIDAADVARLFGSGSPGNWQESLHDCLVFNSRDWTANKTDAWVYAIVVGFSDEALRRIAHRHGWDAETVRRLKQLRVEFTATRQ